MISNAVRPFAHCRRPKGYMRVSSRDRGVTLVEILVVLVIMAIALSIVTPSLGNTYQNWMLRSTGRRAAALFRFAADAARQYGTDIACYYSGHNLVALRNGSVVKRLDIPVFISVQPEKSNGIFALPTGQIVGAERVVLQTDRGRKLTIKFGPLPGQVRTTEE